METSNEGGSNIWIYDVSGRTQIRQLTQGGRNERPIWTPDGERVTFGSDRDGTMSIYLQPADGGGDAERLTTAEEGIEHVFGGGTRLEQPAHKPPSEGPDVA